MAASPFNLFPFGGYLTKLLVWREFALVRSVIRTAVDQALQVRTGVLDSLSVLSEERLASFFSGRPDPLPHTHPTLCPPLSVSPLSLFDSLSRLLDVW